MVIREYIRRRINRIRRFALVAWFGLFACALGLIYGPREAQTVMLIGLVLSGAAFFAAFFYLYSGGVRCPRCKGKVGYLVPYFPLTSTKGPINYCPFCGTSIDEDFGPIANDA